MFMKRKKKRKERRKPGPWNGPKCLEVAVDNNVVEVTAGLKLSKLLLYVYLRCTER